MNVLISGGSRGIGRALINYFVKQNVDNIISISRNKDDFRGIKNNNTRLIHGCMDLANPETINISQILKSYSIDNIDILINNAGYLMNSEFEKTSIDAAYKIFTINVISAAELIKQSLPYLEKSAIAHVVNIGSMGGFQGSQKFSGLSYYSSSKAALIGLTECLAVEYNNKNIRFNCICPGSVQTEMLEEAFPGYKASMTAENAAQFIGEFALHGYEFFNGKTLPMSIQNP